MSYFLHSNSVRIQIPMYYVHFGNIIVQLPGTRHRTLPQLALIPQLGPTAFSWIGGACKGFPTHGPSD